MFMWGMVTHLEQKDPAQLISKANSLLVNHPISSYIGTLQALHDCGVQKWTSFDQYKQMIMEHVKTSAQLSDALLGMPPVPSPSSASSSNLELRQANAASTNAVCAMHMAVMALLHAKYSASRAGSLKGSEGSTYPCSRNMPSLKA
jgi:hypothetical protein